MSNGESPTRCRICNQDMASHGGMNHEFSLTGELRQTMPRPPSMPNRIVKTADTELRALLIGKGLITSDELQLLPIREDSNGNQNSSEAAQPDR